MTCLSEAAHWIGVPSGPFLVSRTGAVGWTKRRVKVPKWALIRSHERCWLLKTAGRWPWKSESAKECVTTHLPKQLALKMDGAKAPHSYPTVAAEPTLCKVLTPRRVGRSQGWRGRLWVWTWLEPPLGADLGGSSKYSREALEDRCGEGFRVNSRWTRVSRS